VTLLYPHRPHHENVKRDEKSRLSGRCIQKVFVQDLTAFQRKSVVGDLSVKQQQTCQKLGSEPSFERSPDWMAFAF
jgi:hypothetical protein